MEQSSGLASHAPCVFRDAITITITITITEKGMATIAVKKRKPNPVRNRINAASRSWRVIAPRGAPCTTTAIGQARDRPGTGEGQARGRPGTGRTARRSRYGPQALFLRPFARARSRCGSTRWKALRHRPEPPSAAPRQGPPPHRPPHARTRHHGSDQAGAKRLAGGERHQHRHGKHRHDQRP